MKILNLYACLGGNRYKWGDEHEITAVELDPELARLYSERFPNDNVIVGDAHQYLLDHYKEFDFIWSSPPCPSHSRSRFWGHGQTKPIYPGMELYQEILFLQHHYEGKYVVENVIPYYDPLIKAQKRGRHLYWTNFKLPLIINCRDIKIGRGGKLLSEFQTLCEFHMIDLNDYKGDQNKTKIARNLVDFESGLDILETAMGIIKKEDVNQLAIAFDDQ